MAEERQGASGARSVPIPLGVIDAMPLMEDGVFRILIWLCRHEYTSEGWQVPARLQEIAKGVGLPPERCRRALSGMVEQGMVLRLPDKRYVLALPLEEEPRPDHGTRGGEAGDAVSEGTSVHGPS